MRSDLTGQEASAQRSRLAADWISMCRTVYIVPLIVCNTFFSIDRCVVNQVDPGCCSAACARQRITGEF